MKQLNQLTGGIRPVEIIGDLSREVRKICFDSREVSRDTLFVAVRGTRTDGHRFIETAISSGATTIVCEEIPRGIFNHAMPQDTNETKGNLKTGSQGSLPENLTVIRVENSAKALGILAANFFDNPSHELQVVGVTGTNGKTTTVTLLYQLFEALGFQSGLISTIRNRIHETTLPATHTTPDPVALQHLLRQMADAGCSYCFMEVSSHAIDQHRIAGIRFAGGIFTNITHDHLDYHETFDRYIEAKKQFFDQLSASAFALVNKDDRRAMVMLQNCQAEKATYALSNVARFEGRVLENSIQGIHMMVDHQEVWFRLIGRFNASNLLAVYAAAILLGMNPAEILEKLSTIGPVEGRFNYVPGPGEVTAIVDYAHTPDALKNVLETINDIRAHQGTLITVIGAGGNRDKAKRPKMAAIACSLSNKVILTSDNPRDEEPEAIIAEMKQGVPAGYGANLLAITDRREAIRTAVMLAGQGDFILVAGKGHETYQEIRGKRTHFDDMEILREQFGNGLTNQAN